MEPALKRSYTSCTEWFAKSGFEPFDDYHDTSTTRYRRYAQRLVRYIRDPSTVRARVLDQYGVSPSLAEITRLRAEWVREVEQRRASRSPDDYDPEPGDFANDDPESDDPVAEAIALDLASSEPISLEAAMGPARELPLSYVEVIARCASRFDLTAEDILGTSRKAPFVRARQFASTVLRARGASYPNVGKWMGDRDHSTIHHGVRQFFDVGMRNPAYVAAWMAIAPCAMKMARTVEELDMLLEAKR